MDRFSTLPEGLEDYGSFKMTLRKLESSSDIFKYTPADSGVIPDFLRRCGIEHFIARRICLFINKPFVDGCTPELEGGAGLLDTIRRQISERSTRCEDIWMALTARAMEPKVNKDILRKKMVQEILCELRGVTDPRNSEQLQRDLVSIVDTAIALWSDLRSDSCRLDFDFEPDLANDNTAWFIQETPPCEIGWGNSNDGRDATLNFTERFQSFALFPRIVITRENGQDPIFKAGDDSNLTSGAGNEEPEKEVVYPGRALFDSSAFIEGARQREELENLYREQMKEFARKRKTSSLTSPVIDKGSTLRSDKQIHQEGEESPLNIKTDE
ncbi:hypothetical protein FQN54_002988 [Arachnomyces sp. PD_36]|nr:hypothetical protein FQN54_002988 [Arachnomyces sp. PD_36]